MSCRRAYEIDLGAFLADPRAAAFADFREHYPRCAACAAEVRAWTELLGLLRPPATHPAPEKLLALEDDRAALAPVERAALEEHVARCTSCRDELAALRGFRGPAPAAAPADSGLRSLLAGVRRLLVQPAFAYAVALLFAMPLLYRLVVSEHELAREAPVERGYTSERHKVARATTPAPSTAEPAPAPAASAALRDEADREVPLAKNAPAPQPKKEPLRALGSVGEEKREAAPQSPSAQAFSANEGRAAARDALAAEAAGPAQAAPRPVLERAGPDLYRLRVPLEPGMQEVEVRVSPPGGGRMLSQDFRGAAGEVTLDIPASWIAPGTWRIERRSHGRRDVLRLQVP